MDSTESQTLESSHRSSSTRDRIKKRSDFLPFHIPDVNQDEIDAVTEVLRSPWLTSGPKVRQFEEEFASATGAKYAVAVNSCTAALHLAYEALGLGPGDEILIPAMTFTATAEAAIYLQAKPILVDVDRETQHIDLRDAERKLTPRTKAIAPVHVAGLPCDMPAIMEFAKAHRLEVIEDAAHAFPAASHGRKIGSISAATCFSFYATKTITTGEGGMLTTNREEIAARSKIMRTHGLNRDAWKRQEDGDSWYYEIVESGFKYNFTDIAAAIGIAQLRKAEAMRVAREKIANYYLNAFRGRSEFLLPPTQNSDDQNAWHLFTLRLNPEALSISRNQFIRELKARNIGASVHWIPLHLHPFYIQKFGCKPEDFPNATWLSERIVSLPIFSKMSSTDSTNVVDAVCDIAREFKR